MDTFVNVSVEELSEALSFPVEAYVSQEYARAEGDRLWSKVWLHAARVEEIPDVGDYVTFDVGAEVIDAPIDIREIDPALLGKSCGLLGTNDSRHEQQCGTCVFHRPPLMRLHKRNHLI